MSGFSFRNVRYPRYQHTDLLQLWQAQPLFVHILMLTLNALNETG